VDKRSASTWGPVAEALVDALRLSTLLLDFINAVAGRLQAGGRRRREYRCAPIPLRS